jgi:hypothetical protein
MFSLRNLSIPLVILLKTKLQFFTMKKIFTLLSISAAITLTAQKTLPYSNMVDTPSEIMELTEYRLGATNFFNWSTTGGVISHDYPVGATSTDTTYDWMVTPELDFTYGAKLSMVVRGFAIIGITPEDYFGVWVSNGAKDPAMGDYVEVADLSNYILAESGFQDTNDIDLGVTAGSGYVAFVYGATNNWYTVAVDSIEVNATTSIGVAEEKTLSKTKIYPTIADNNITIEVPYSFKRMKYSVLNLAGQEVKIGIITESNNELDVSGLKSGVYFYNLKDGKNQHTIKFIKK